ncbi:anti-sigma factor antagonist [Streptomyces populi]|uniref:Anti-sigma factor antagonist n=1 Tax=Streptomyces populi TaxID=2058924 RepID=A0A2I0SK87_9ACTN|nr:STAS domain-containing protein [Streptomyces populi]PKT70342.1 anti-sigma factor antagonist [Streptomyces populi]
MTTSHPPAFTLTVDVQPTALVIRVGGDLDHETCDELMRAVDQNLPGAGLLELRVDFAGLEGVDSMGLSTLLMIRRRTDAAGVRLHLDRRPRVLDRLLEITGTLEHLTAPRDGHGGERSPGAG